MKRLYPYFLVLFTFSFVSSIANAAPSSKLWERWTQHDPTSTQTIDHLQWGQILNSYLKPEKNGVNGFAYNAVSKRGHEKLKGYIASLADTKISEYNRDEQLAYWVNLYNALTVEIIVQNYPVFSIRDISSGFFSSGPWGLDLVTVEGEKLTLNDIEHRILRPIWNDPRIHYAVNCASIGCPNLQPKPFTAQQNEAMLESAAVEFINHPRAVKISNSGDLRVSSIYDWFGVDFGGEKGVIEHLRQYARPELKQVLEGITEIDSDHYDWNLNGVREPINPNEKGKSSGRSRGSS